MNITSMIEACGWGVSKYLIFSDNVFAPLIYYSHLMPIILSLVMGLFIVLHDPKALLNKTVFVLTVLFSLWAMSDLVLWAHESPRYIMFFWSSLILLEPIIYATSVYFLYVFITKKAPPLTVHLILFALLLPTVILSSTHLSIIGFNLVNCEREVIEGILVYYGYFVEIILTLWVLIYGFFSAKKYGKDLNNQFTFVTVGTALFLLATGLGNIVGSFSENWSIGQYGFFGMPIFVAFLVYITVKYKSFNVKLMGVQALVIAIGLLTLGLLFIRRIENVRAVVIPTLFCFIFLGYQLVKSVKKEVESKERLLKLSAELQASNTRLKELDAQKTEFLSFATHQIRSPLASMKGYASLILEGDVGEISEATRKTTETILASANTLANVVEGYLNITRIELGTMKYDMKDIDFGSLLAEVVNEQKPNVEAKGLALSVSVDASETYPIKADIDKFKQVLMNIIDNSVKYTNRGSISISLERDAGKGIMRFVVQDTGVGIAPEVMPKLFRKFSRAANASEVNIHGTGLGLYIAKEIVAAHGGRMWAESEGEGKGSRFIVEMREGR